MVAHLFGEHFPYMKDEGVDGITCNYDGGGYYYQHAADDFLDGDFLSEKSHA